jgi:hypothetical protein
VERSELEQLLRTYLGPVASKWEVIEKRIGLLEARESPSTPPTTLQASIVSQEKLEKSVNPELSSPSLSNTALESWGGAATPPPDP